MPHCKSSVVPVRTCAGCARVRTYNELPPSKFGSEPSRARSGLRKGLRPHWASNGARNPYRNLIRRTGVDVPRPGTRRPVREFPRKLFNAAPVSRGSIFLAIVLSLISHDMMYGPQAALIAESFTGRLRYNGSSLGYQLASVIAGGPAPLIATSLFGTYHSSYAIAVYIAA